MKTLLFTILVAFAVAVAGIAAEQDASPARITAYCFSMKSADALAFMAEQNATGLPERALPYLRELAKSRKATDLGAVSVIAPHAEYATAKEKDLTMDAEFVNGPEGFVTLNAVVQCKLAKVTGTAIGNRNFGGPAFKGLRFLGCAFRDVSRAEVMMVFVSVGKP